MSPASCGNDGRPAPYTIVLGDGLEEEVLSPQIRYFDSRTHVGEREVERLLGRGRSFGQGPLPRFLRAALERRESGARVDVILLAHVDGDGGNASRTRSTCRSAPSAPTSTRGASG
jgi:hypothetical protein